MTTTTVNEAPPNRLVRKIRLRAVLFFFLALAAGGGAVFLVKLYIDRTTAAAAVKPIPTTDVVVAAASVPIGTQLERSQLTIVAWPAANVPAGTFATVEQVVGRSLEQGVVSGEPILADRLADPARGRGMAAILEPGHRAMAVKVDQVVGVAGFVQPGDFVDVLTTMKPDDEGAPGSGGAPSRIAKIILQNIRVLAVGQRSCLTARRSARSSPRRTSRPRRPRCHRTPCS